MTDRNAKTILIIQWHRETHAAITKGLEEKGFRVSIDIIGNGKGLNTELKNKADLIIVCSCENILKYLSEKNPEIFSEQAVPVILIFDYARGKKCPYADNMPVYACFDKDSTHGMIADTAQLALRWSRKKSREHMHEFLINGMFEGLYVIDFEGNIIEVNDGAARTLGYTKEEILKKGLFEIDCLISPEGIKNLAATMPMDEIQIFETIHRKSNGEEIPVEIYSSIVNYMGRKTILSMARDITVRREMETKIKNQLAEKEILIKAIHHRIKNNIASITALLSIQMSQTDNGQVRDALVKALGRIQCMQILYETLLQNYDMPFKRYLESLMNAIMDMYQTGIQIAVNNNIQDIVLKETMFFPLGVVFEEILTNIMKYAFQNMSHGKIDISMTENDGIVKLEIQDDGVGLPENFDAKIGFGIRIINIMSEQLNGEFSISNRNGTRALFTFRI
ncbi:MAG: PAS domain S-box protein [Spirochaetales bacterium]|nr:PAS domain S-box protein [Spirochaetales bacterium]